MGDPNFYRMVDLKLDEEQVSDLIPESDESEGEDDQQYVVEAILDHREINGVTEYLIKWDGYSSDDNTWEPKRNIKPETIQLYEQSIRKNAQTNKAKLATLAYQRKKSKKLTSHAVLDKNQIIRGRKLKPGWPKRLVEVVDVRKINDEVKVIAKWTDQSLSEQTYRIVKQKAPKALLDFFYRVIFEDIPLSKWD